MTLHTTWHSRFWWVDVARGGIAILFGVFLLVDPSATLPLLGRLLGLYLLVDGSIDLLTTLSHRHRNFSFRDLLSSCLILGVGLLGIVIPTVLLLLIIIMVVAHGFIRGWQWLRTAQREQSHLAGITWLGSLIIFALAALIAVYPDHSLRIIVTLLIIMVMVQGSVTIFRSLLQHYTAGQASMSLAPEMLPFDATGAPTARRALIFVRRYGALGLGHIGWAFEWHNGWFNAGSVENDDGKPVASPESMGFWTSHTLDPIAAMQRQRVPYDEYKLCIVPIPQPKHAWRVVIWVSQQPYVVLRRNCNDAVYDILRTYGVADMANPDEEFVPNNWYDALPGRSYRIADYPHLPLALSLQGSHQPHVQDIPLTIPPQMHGETPPWQQADKRWWVQLDAGRKKMVRDVRGVVSLLAPQKRPAPSKATG